MGAVVGASAFGLDAALGATTEAAFDAGLEATPEAALEAIAVAAGKGAKVMELGIAVMIAGF